MLQDGNSSAYASGQRTGTPYLIGLVVVLVFVLALVKGIVSVGEDGSAGLTQRAATAGGEPFDPSRFVLNALLVPALDGDALPLRWVDPRPALGCGPAARVRVNGAPLRPGALVPDTPFELEWNADACRPFGAAGPRFDGGARLAVFREDWGFSAFVTPSSLRITPSGLEPVVVHEETAAMPQSGPDEDLQEDAEEFGPAAMLIKSALRMITTAFDQHCNPIG
ncbi:MAG: hypothetical protein ABI624_03065 [Casimicrobiaceae bacterium]